MTTFGPVNTTTALKTLAAARVLIPGEEEILFAFTDENGQELVFTTESIITVNKKFGKTTTERFSFPWIDGISFRVVVTSMPAIGVDFAIKLVFAREEDPVRSYAIAESKEVAKAVYNAIFTLNDDGYHQREDHQLATRLVKEMLAGVLNAPGKTTK